MFCYEREEKKRRVAREKAGRRKLRSGEQERRLGGATDTLVPKQPKVTMLCVFQIS